MKASAVRAKINKYVRNHGYTIEELYGASAKLSAGKLKKKIGRMASTSIGSKVVPKYRSPADPNETGSVRGRQPKWLAALVQNENAPSELLIR